MYSIDFKVHGQLVSINVAPNDTLATLVGQMKLLHTFQKFSPQELKDKLLKNLTLISTSPSIDPNIKKKLEQFLNHKTPVKQPQSQQKPSESKPNPINNTFVNMLQQSSINNSTFIKGLASETKLKRKYLSNELYENDQEIMQGKLKFNYDSKNQPPYHKISPEKPAYFSKSTHNKRSYSYLNPNINQQPVRNIARQQLYPSSDSVKNDHQFQFEPYSRKSPVKSSAKRQKSYHYALEPQIPVQIHYNPVPKLEELIQRTKSLSTMGHKNSGLSSINSGINYLQDKNLNLMNEKRNLMKDQDLRGGEKRKTVGRIQRRQDLSTHEIKKEFKQEKVFTRSKENQPAQRQRLYEKGQFQLKKNYDTIPHQRSSQNLPFPTTGSINGQNRSIQNRGQNRRKDMRKVIY